MRIGIDIRPLQKDTRYRGIGKYLENLLISLAKIGNQNSYIFFAERGLPIPKEILNKFNNSKLQLLAPYRAGRIRVVRAFLPSNRIIKTSKRELDVLMETDVTLGSPKNVPVVMAFHDAIPLIFKDKEIIDKTTGYRKLKRQLASYLYSRRFNQQINHYKTADHIIAISEQSKKDLQKYILGELKKPVDVVYLGLNRLHLSQSPPKPVNGLASSDKFLLYVGGIDVRKNVVGLGEAFLKLKKFCPDLKLVMVGKEFGLKGQLADLGWTKIEAACRTDSSLVEPGFVDDSTLQELYKSAQAFVFPSRYEGFGLPILEAMQAGCPVIAYDNSAIPEVAGDAALLVEDGGDLVPAITKILEDSKLRQDYINKGKQRVKLFTWDNCAAQTLAVLKKVAEQNGPQT